MSKLSYDDAPGKPKRPGQWPPAPPLGSGTATAFERKIPELPSVNLAQKAICPLSFKPLARPSEPPLPPRKISELTTRVSPTAICSWLPVTMIFVNKPDESVAQIPCWPFDRLASKATCPASFIAISLVNARLISPDVV